MTGTCGKLGPRGADGLPCGMPAGHDGPCYYGRPRPRVTGYPAGVAPPITAAEFAQRYIVRSGVPVFSYGFRVYRCYCQQDGCDGWAMFRPVIGDDEVARGRASGPVPAKL